MVSNKIVNQILPFYDKIVSSRFISDITHSKLNPRAFLFYLQQDVLYLEEYEAAMKIIANSLQEPSDKEKVTKCAERARTSLLSYKQYLAQNYTLAYEKSPICYVYTKYMLETAHNHGPIGGLVAAIPCMLIYRLLGDHFRKHAKVPPTVKYHFWIKEITDPNDKSNSSFVNAASIIDTSLARHADSELAKLIEIAEKSAQFEYLLFEESIDATLSNNANTFWSKDAPKHVNSIYDALRRGTAAG